MEKLIKNLTLSYKHSAINKISRQKLLSASRYFDISLIEHSKSKSHLVSFC